MRHLLLASVLFGALSAFAAVEVPTRERPVAAVFQGLAPGAPSDLARDLAVQAEAAGFVVQLIDVSTLTNSSMLSTARFDLLVLPNGRTLPVESIEPLHGFLQQGGDLLALGTPLWEAPLFRFQDRWISRADYEATLAEVRTEKALFDFAKVDVGKWTRSTNGKRATARREVLPTPQGPALHVSIEEMEGWDTLAAPTLEKPFSTGHTLTCFRAKGGAKTGPFMIEWMERDGSRWIATVELTPEWKTFALPPSAFHAWEPRSGRGGKGDTLKLENVMRLTVGVALSHGATPGAHAYWLAEFGTARNPFGDFTLPAQVNLPHLESLSPAYLFYPVLTPVRLQAAPEMAALGKEPITPLAWPADLSRALMDGRASPLNGLHPRPQGAGFNQDRPWRWQPLLVARAEDGDHRGAAAALLVHERAPYRGGLWGCFTPAEPGFYRSPAMRQTLRQVLAGIRRGVFLLEGGSEFFTVFDDQTFRLGARVANFGVEPQTKITVRITAAAGDGPPTWSKEWTLQLAAGEEKSVEQLWKPPEWPAAGFRVTTELLEDGTPIDRLAHDLNVWRPKSKPEFVEARDGGLWLRGQPWKAHGVNYMPSSGIGLASGQYFEHWIGRGAYDPEVIERDLRRIKAMGMNAASVFIHRQSMEAQHQLDFLRRCEALGLRVNQSLRPGTPLDFRWREMKELIEFYRLAQNDTVFAYDLAWEPSHLGEEYQRRHYASGWNAWVVKRYGNLGAAETAWGIAAPRDRAPTY